MHSRGYRFIGSALLFALFVAFAPGCAGPAPFVPWGAKDQPNLAYVEPDHDRDGIDNTFDRCPDLPEDEDGHRDDDGCPDPDNDGDGIADAKDEE